MLAVALKTSVKMVDMAKKINERKHKAMGAAISREAFSLRKEGKESLKKGNLGLKPLSILQRKHGKKSRKTKVKAPLKKLASGILYKVDKRNLKAEVGFIGTTPGTEWQAVFARKHLYGFAFSVTPKIMQAGQARGVYFQKGTRSIAVPSRDIMGAVYVKHGRDSARNIAVNFERKLRGENIYK